MPPPTPAAIAAAAKFAADWLAGRPPALEAVVRVAPEAVRDELFRRLLPVERDCRLKAGRPLGEAEARGRFAALGGWAGDALDAAFPAVVLEVTAGPHAGAAFPLAGHARFTLGRRPGLDLSLPDDPYLSGVHLVVEVNPPLARVTDLNSKNGVTVNGARVPHADLADGDLIRAGRTALRVNAPALARDRTVSLPPGAEVPSGTTAPDRPPAVPGYRLGRELGRGGMGVVYAATCEATGEDAAVKLILPAVAPTPAAVARFRREAEVLARLSHPHVVGHRAAGAAGGLLYFAMEYAPGPTAARVLKRSGPVPPARLLVWAGQLLDALHHAHARGVVHRDVKPANLIVTAVNGADHLKLADFGLAKAYDASGLSGLTADNTSGGTPLFMPPEQVRDLRGVGPAADQYSAAATLYHLLTGTHVYDRPGNALELYMMVMTDDPLPLRPGAADLPAPFGPVVRRGLARDPKDRYPDARAMKAALLGG